MSEEAYLERKIALAELNNRWFKELEQLVFFANGLKRVVYYGLLKKDYKYIKKYYLK